MNQPMSKLSASADRRDSTVAATAGRATGSRLCLIVHDDMDLRLRLAALVRRVSPLLDADSVDRTAFAALSLERIGHYLAVLFIIEFSLPAGGADPLANVARLAEEVGELAREVNHQFGPKPKKPDEAPGSIGMELADILFVVICLANSQRIDLDDAFKQVMAKVTSRDAGRWSRKAR